MFPGVERAAARFPTLGALAGLAGAARLTLVDAIDVVEVWVVDLAVWADGVAGARHADSMLVPLTDDEVAAGVEALRAEARRRPGLQPVEVPLRLVTFARG